jgi:hypothetical protein
MVALRKSHVLDFFLSHMLSHWVLQQRDFSHMAALGFRYMVASTFWIFTIPAYCSWDFQNLDLNGILGSRVHRQLFWLLAGCFFYGNQSIFLVSGWMLFLWSSHIVDSVWTIFIVASFWVLGSLSGCPLTDIMRNVYMHVYSCITYMREMIFIQYGQCITNV